jgi:excisionase family DNA binding protein
MQPSQPASAALLVNAREAARMLAVSPRKLWAMTFEEQHGLPYIRCGRLVRYSVADLQRWIESQRQGGEEFDGGDE